MDVKFLICIPPEEDALASKAFEIHVSIFFNLEVVCPMQNKTIPLENYDLRHDSNYKLEKFDFEFEQKLASSRYLLK